MLHKLTVEPQTFGATDIIPLLEAGLRPAAIEHPILIGGYLFNMHNRVIDALGCDLADENIASAARALNQAGKKPIKDLIEDGQTVAFEGRMPQKVVDWIATVEAGEGTADPALRVAIMNRAANWTGGRPRKEFAVPKVVAEFTDTVTRNAVEVTDDHITGMKDAGYSELEIFEFTFAAATGAGLARLEIGWDALTEAIRELR
jgi:hypothetical protein